MTAGLTPAAHLRTLTEAGATLTGAEITIRALQAEGVEYVFGYPGGAVLFIYDAIFRQKAVKHVLVRGSLHQMTSQRNSASSARLR